MIRRRWIFVAAWGALFVVALSSGVDILFYVAYLLAFLVGATWWWTRSSISSMRVKRDVSQGYVHLGDEIELTYELANDSRLGKIWLEVYEESNWPEPLPGRVLSIGAFATKRWKVAVPALRRGRFHLGPVVIRSGDPFGIFSAEYRARYDALVLVYPRVVPLPYWQLPGSLLEGSVLTGRRSLQATSMVMGIRDYRPGDAFNHIHWKTSARHRSLQVKEFELDRTADLWIFLDLERRWHTGEGERSTEERAVTIAASVIAKALREHRTVGLVASGRSSGLFPPDRGMKQFSKLMQYLAEVSAGGSRSIAETMVETLPRLRRGASALVISPSLDKEWVKPVLALRESGVRIQACLIAGEDVDDAARAKLNAVVGDLLLGGIPYALSTSELPISELFHERVTASA
ncbi:MAG TPA: DUF58 domain-containing protein [Candidatus Dormibacteraeota bacterium]|jgi:uncharacterized protein (DUF58 family)|nr:DUF58 domain-containing protein [Candidatus Dormibacteraeota bacterium]